MIRRFYQSYNALKYSAPLTTLAFLIFVEAFMYTSRRTTGLRTVMIFTALILAGIMVLYYGNKIRINRTLKNIKNLSEYEKGGCVDRSWFLENRMLVSDHKNLAEYSTHGIDSAELIERNHGRYYLHICQSSKEYDISLTDQESGERTAAFLLRKNPDIRLIHVHPKGDGSLRELGADA